MKIRYTVRYEPVYDPILNTMFWAPFIYDHLLYTDVRFYEYDLSAIEYVIMLNMNYQEELIYDQELKEYTLYEIIK